MKKTIVIILLSILGLVIVTNLVFVVRAIDYKSKAEKKSYLVEKEYSKVNIDSRVEDVNIYLSENSETKIVCVENKNVYFEIKVKDETLFIKKVDNRKFYDRIFDFGSYNLDVYLSKSVIEELDINSNTADITIHRGFVFEKVKINNSTGDLEFSSKVTEVFDIETSTGEVDVEDCEYLGQASINTSTGNIDIRNTKCESLTIEVSTGEVDLEDVIVTKDLKINGSTGDVSFEDIDAENIYIELSTGDVEGTILSSKFFDADSDTGRVNVPKTREGGECIIRVSTGDINISYK